MKLDEKALEAARRAFANGEKFSDQLPSAIRAYLTSATPPDVAGIDDMLDRFERAAFAATANLPRGRDARERESKSRSLEYNAARDAIATALRLSAGGGASHAARDVLEERRRQVEVEDFDASHDDMATKGQLAGAAASYAMHDIEHWAGKEAARTIWPWDKAWWKPANRRRNLVKAGALILAEIERLDRLPASPTVEAGRVE